MSKTATIPCKQGHEMLKSHRHCGKCGSGPKDDLTVKCANAKCGGVFAKGAVDFCTDCGDKVTEANPAATLDAQLLLLTEYSKSAAAFVAGDKLPLVDETLIDTKEIEALIKSAALKDDKGEITGYDAVPPLEEMLKGQAHQALEGRAFAEHGTQWFKSIQTGLLAAIGTIAAQSEVIKSLSGKLDTVLAKSSGRRSIDRLEIAPTRDAAGGEGAGDDDLPDGMSDGDVLFAKCQVAAGIKPDLFTPLELVQLETWTQGHGYGREQIAQHDRGLALKCVTAERLAEGAKQ